MIFKEPICKFLTQILDKSYFKKSLPMEGDLKKSNQRWKCSFHKEKWHRSKNCKALKVFLNQLVQDRYLKGFVDQEKTQAKEAGVKPNPRID